MVDQKFGSKQLQKWQFIYGLVSFLFQFLSLKCPIICWVGCYTLYISLLSITIATSELVLHIKLSAAAPVAAVHLVIS